MRGNVSYEEAMLWQSANESIKVTRGVETTG
jgi:hypothetical protein